MKLVNATWPEVDALSRDAVILIPTGSVEQHGHHLPLGTDSMIATALAERAVDGLGDKVVLMPTVWLGASLHHLPFCGSQSASFGTYHAALRDIVDAWTTHGFWRFCVLTAHGGNTEPNGVVLRELKYENPHLQLAHTLYSAFWPQELLDKTLTGGIKGIRHACEAEASMMLYLHPELVRTDKLRDDGLVPSPNMVGLVSNFDEITDAGSFGYATLATADKGKILVDAAVQGVRAWIEQAYTGVLLAQI